jgi:hypothetical protein
MLVQSLLDLDVPWGFVFNSRPCGIKGTQKHFCGCDPSRIRFAMVSKGPCNLCPLEARGREGANRRVQRVTPDKSAILGIAVPYSKVVVQY